MELNEWKGSEKKPWWNDGDKVGGAFATIVLLGAALVILALFIRLAVNIISG